MSALKNKLERAAAFDRQHHLDRISEWREAHELGNARVTDVALAEHARLTPLLEALISVAVAADRLDECLLEFGECVPCSEYGNHFDDALARLKAVLG